MNKSLKLDVHNVLAKNIILNPNIIKDNYCLKTFIYTLLLEAELNPFGGLFIELIN